MNLDSRKGGVKASRFYALTFVVLTGGVGMVSPPDLGLMTAQAQTTQDSKAEADRLINQGNQQDNISQFEAALQSYQQALNIYREIKFRQGELCALGGIGLEYYFLGKYDKAIEFYLQHLAIARGIKDRLGEGQSLGNLGIAYKKGDVPITEALRRAQVSLIKSSKYNHPNYWSAFFAIGNGL